MSKIRSGETSISFRNYLEELAAKNPRRKKYQNLDEKSDVALYTGFTTEFKNFFVQEYGEDALEDFSLGGKDTTLHINEDGEIELAGDEELDDDDELILDMLNALMEDDKFRETIDTDGVEGISDDEINAFFNASKDYGDEDGDTVSVKDLLTATKDIKKGKFDTSKLTAATETPASGAVSGGGGGGGGGGLPKTDGGSQMSLPDLSGKSVSELETIKSEAQGTLNDIATKLQNIDEEESVKNAKTAYDAEVKKASSDVQTYCQNRDILQKTIDEQCALQLQYQTQATSLEADMNACQGRIDGYDASINANNSSISELENKMQSAEGLDDEQKAEAEASNAAIQAQIDALQARNQELEVLKENAILEKQEKQAQYIEAMGNYQNAVNECETAQAEFNQNELNKPEEIPQAVEDAYTAYTGAKNNVTSSIAEDYQKATLNLQAVVGAIAKQSQVEAQEATKTEWAETEQEDGSKTQELKSMATTVDTNNCATYWQRYGTKTTENETIIYTLPNGASMEFTENKDGTLSPKYDTYKSGQKFKSVEENEVMTVTYDDGSKMTFVYTNGNWTAKTEVVKDENGQVVGTTYVYEAPPENYSPTSGQMTITINDQDIVYEGVPEESSSTTTTTTAATETGSEPEKPERPVYSYWKLAEGSNLNSLLEEKEEETPDPA